MNKPKAIEQYFAKLDESMQVRLEELRAVLLEVAPDAEEVLSYGVPALKQGKVLACYAAHKGHLGLYPTPGPIKAFAKELKPYKTAEGTIQFPYDQKLPKALIKKVMIYRLKEVTG